jgi:hypothetical protein
MTKRTTVCFFEAVVVLNELLPQLDDALVYVSAAGRMLATDRGNLVIAEDALRNDPACGWALEMAMAAKRRDVAAIEATIAENQAIIDEVRQSIDVVVGYREAHVIGCDALVAVLLGMDGGNHMLIQNNLDDARNVVYRMQALAVATTGVVSATGAEPGAETRQAVLQKLAPAHRKAYFAFQYAESKNEKCLADDEAYRFLKENGIDEEGCDEHPTLMDYELPCIETWKRYLREARKALHEQKHRRREKPPITRSIVKGDQIEDQKGNE